MLIGCWNAKEGRKIEFKRNGQYIVNDTLIWNYKYNEESQLIEVTGGPFDDFKGNKGILVKSINESELLLYDKMWSKEVAFTRCF